MSTGKEARDRMFAAIATEIMSIVAEYEATPENVAGVLHAMLATAAATAIRFDVDEAALMRMTRSAYAYAMAETRAVDAEDDN